MNWWVLRRGVHTSWLIAIAAVGCVAGGLVIGLWRGAAEYGHLQAYEALRDHTVVLTGSVQEDIDQRPDGQLAMKLGTVIYEGQSLPGTVWVSFDQSTHDIWRSDRVTVHGKLSEGFGNVPASMYRVTIVKVERPEPGDVALRLRDTFGNAVRSVVPEPEASLGLGYVVGQRRSLPEELAEALRIAGLTHVIVASGYNLTILVRFARRLFARISRFTGLIASSGLVLCFIAVTGISPSMSRAGLVTGLCLLAWYYGRQFHPLVLLSLVAALTVIVNPSYAWGDIGWQLSFAAFAGVMIMAPLLQVYFFGSKKPGLVRQIMGETIAAQLATLPIIIMTFGQISNVALVANILVLPLVPLAMLLTFATGIVSLVMPVLALVVAAPTTWPLHYMTEVATHVAGLPWATGSVEWGNWALLLYIPLIAFCVYSQRVTHLRLRDGNIVE